MLLDLRTLIFVLAASNALIFILIGTSIVGSRRDVGGVNCWLWSYAVQSIGWSLLLLRNIAPDWLSILVGNTMLFMSVVLIFRAIRDFLERPLPWRNSSFTVAVFLIVFLVIFLFDFGSTAIVSWISLSGGIMGVACAWTLMKGIRWRSAPARWTTGLWLGIGGIVMILRAIGVVLSPNPDYNLFTQSLLQVVAFIVVYSSMLGASFGFNLMLQERTTQSLQHIARMDELTGVFNRRYLLDKVRHELHRMKRRKNDNLILMMLDIDNFKAVNDQHGHAAGDHLLKKFAEQLSTILRTPDILGRYGGEEFCVLLPDTDLTKGLQVAERLRVAANDAHISVGDEKLQRTVSIGVAHICKDTMLSLDELFLAADRALYQAKQEGRNRIVCAEKAHSVVEPYTTASPIGT